jgi:hypothetical protein
MSSIPPSSCNVLWTPDVIVNVVYRGVMIAVIAVLAWERYRHLGHIVDGEFPNTCSRILLTWTRRTIHRLHYWEQPSTPAKAEQDRYKVNVKGEEAVNPKHAGIINYRNKVRTKAEKSVKTRHTYLEKGSKLDMIATAADVMNSFGEAVITL